MRHLTEVHVARSENDEAQQCLELLMDSLLQKNISSSTSQEELICLDMAMIHQKLGNKASALIWIKGPLSSRQMDIRILALVHTLFLCSDDTEKVTISSHQDFFSKR